MLDFMFSLDGELKISENVTVMLKLQRKCKALVKRHLEKGHYVCILMKR